MANKVKLPLPGKKSAGKKVKSIAANATCVNKGAITKPKPRPKPKFSPEDEARIQAEVERIKRAKHEQMIAEEIRNRVASV